MRIQEIRAETQPTGRRRVGALPFLAPPIIAPAAPAIGPHRSWPTPGIIGGLDIAALRRLKRTDNEFDPTEGSGRRKVPNITATFAPQFLRFTGAAIPAHRAWPTPTIAGPQIISPATLIGPRRFATPSVTVDQKITMAAALSGPRSWPTPAVANVQTIAPAGPAIGPHRSWPSPTVAGAPQFISVGRTGVSAITGPRSWPTPGVSGGTQGTFLFLSGVDRTRYFRLDTNPCQIQSQTIGRWTMTLDFYNAAGVDDWAPVLGQSIVVIDYGDRVFAGCITEIVTERFLSREYDVLYHVTATDKSGICDRRLVTGKTYAAADWDDCTEVVLDIVANYLVGEGITTQGVPASLGPLDADLNFNFVSVYDAFTQIAQMTGTIWWIDTYGVLFFSSFENLPAAPFSISETSGNWRAATGAETGLTTTQTTQSYLNKIYALSNVNVIPTANPDSETQPGTTETFTFTPGNPGISPYLDPNGRPNGIVTSIAIGSVISMTVNGHTQTVFDFRNDFNGQTSSGLTDYLWDYVAGNNQLNWTFEPPAGATIVLIYVPFASTGVSIAQYGEALKPIDPMGQPLGGCGSGLYEGIIQVKSINDQSQLNAIAQAELNRIGTIPTVVAFQTDHPGLRPGQLLTCDIPLSGAGSKQLLITSVNGYHKSADLGYGGSFQWDVEATTNLDPGNFVAWYARQIARAQYPLPVLQTEIAKFVLGPGASVSSANSETNPYIVNKTGLVYQVAVAAGTVPVDEDLYLTITRNGVAIATVTLPSTATANITVAFPVPQANQLWLYAGDVLNINTNYQVTGSSPVPAGNVTVNVSWAF